MPQLTISQATALRGQRLGPRAIDGQMLAGGDIVMLPSERSVAGLVIGLAAAGAYELGSRLIQGTHGVCTASMPALGRAGVVGATALASALMSVALAVPFVHAFAFIGIAAPIGVWILVIGLWFLRSRIVISMGDYPGTAKGPFLMGLLAMSSALPVGIWYAPQDRVMAMAPFLLSVAIFSVIHLSLGWKFVYLPRFGVAAAAVNRWKPSINHTAPYHFSREPRTERKCP